MTYTYSTRHTHRAIPGKTDTRPFFGAVASRQNPIAHGGVTLVDHCRCGAERRTNSNAGAIERGPWTEADRG